MSAARPWIGSFCALLCLGAVACSDDGDGGPAIDAAGSDAATVVDAAPLADAAGEEILRYNMVRQKSSHNSYRRDEAHFDQLVYHRIRSLEFDLHVRKTGARVPGDWFVYHDFLERDTTCHMLSDCLAEMAAFDNGQPGHEVVTLWIDLKDAFEDEHRPADLDALLATALPPGSVFRPADLMQACPQAQSFKEAVTGACAWPTLEALRGRFIVVLTGGDVSDPQSRLAEYLDQGGDPGARMAFVAPDLTDAARLSGDPNVIFLNMELTHVDLAREVTDAGYVGRVWLVNNETDWARAAVAHAHHIATDKINHHVDQWAITHEITGWPFQCLEPCEFWGGEPDLMLAVEVFTGDIWGTSDSFWFFYKDDQPGRILSWTGFVSTANSHIEEWAKGCLMARASTAADAAYFAVCRPADNQRLRVQKRLTSGADSSAIEADITAPDTIDPESAAFIRMDVDADARCITGLGSYNGNDWVAIDQQCFNEPLHLQGVAASSHDAGLLRLIFGRLHRIADTAEPLSSASFDNEAAIGGASGSAWDI